MKKKFSPVSIDDMQTCIIYSHLFCPKRCTIFWNECKINFLIFAIFSFWDMVSETRGLGKEPPVVVWGVNPPIIQFYLLRFWWNIFCICFKWFYAKEILKKKLSEKFSRKFVEKYKIDNISKIKNRTKKNHFCKKKRASDQFQSTL